MHLSMKCTIFFRLSITPLQEAGKLAMILVQFPPWFDCTKENVDEIRYVCREIDMDSISQLNLDISRGILHNFRQQTLRFLRELNVIHSVCDEPQAGQGSIPLVPISTRSG